MALLFECVSESTSDRIGWPERQERQDRIESGSKVQTAMFITKFLFQILELTSVSKI